MEFPAPIPLQMRGFAISPLPEPPTKAGAHPPLALVVAVEQFLLGWRVANCSAPTMETYERNLGRFVASAPPALESVTPLLVQQYLTALRAGVKPITAHQHFRCLKTFCTWCVEVDLLSGHPMRGMTMQLPKTLPTVPEDDHVRRLLLACPDTFEGRRNRALVALLADSGLRISEVLRLRVEDVNFATRTIAVRGGKGGKDGVGFFGSEAAQYLRAWLSKRREAWAEDHLFVDRTGRSLTRTHALHVLHRYP